MIEVEYLTKIFGQRTAVADVSFSAAKGEAIGLLGPNGSGKTTIMRTLAGYFPPTSGRVAVAGIDVVADRLQARAKVGYLPETATWYPEMRVSEFLALCADIRGLRGAPRRARLDAVRSGCGLVEVERRLIGTLSKGYKQRVGLAQAILHNPEVLILDEPTAGLDPKQRIETRSLIQELAGEHTIILCSHILPEVSQLCQRVVIINKGKVVAVDTPENLTASVESGGRTYLEVEGAGPGLSAALSSLPGVTRVTVAEAKGAITGFDVESEAGRDVRRAVAATVVGAGAGLLELRPKRMSLEDVFLQLLTNEAAGSGTAHGEDVHE
jgi:ABC-2 type transport system ATP-binding protein